MKKKRRAVTDLEKNNSRIKRHDRFGGIIKAIEQYDSWIPWAIALIYFLVMSYLTFRYHRIGGEGVEIDFYAELVPQTKKLLAGQFSPLNYSSKGPVYSFLLGAFYLVIRDYFYAGLLINLLSGSVFLVTVYFLIKKVFNITTAFIVTLAISFNYVFLSYTYQAASDMPFMAMCALSMYFLFKSNRFRDLVFSALLGLLAFLIRYNGVFIAMGSLLYLALIGGPARERLKRIGQWFGVFILAGLPWFVPNWIATGNPVHNDNYVNVMLEFYTLGKDNFSYENWADALPKEFSSLGDIFFYNPVYFLKHMVHNVLTHFIADMTELLGWRLGIFVVLGFISIWFVKADRKKLVYFSFGLFNFLFLTLIFYNPRFSLYLTAFYAPLAVWPLTEQKIKKFIGRFLWVSRAILILVILSYSYTTTKVVLFEMKHSPAFLNDLKDLGLALGKIEPDKSMRIIGRKPHVAYYASLETAMFPEKVRTVEDLVEFCRENNIKYVLYSGVEEYFRPHLNVLLNINQKHTGLEKVYHNRFGVIYRVTGISDN